MQNSEVVLMGIKFKNIAMLKSNVKQSPRKCMQINIEYVDICYTEKTWKYDFLYKQNKYINIKGIYEHNKIKT